MVAADAMMSGGDGQPETLAGVTVTLDGEHAMGETMETGMDGGFAFTGLRAGTYTVTISDFPEDVSFETVSVEVEVDVGDVGSADFTGHYIRTSAIEGQVITDSEGLPGVTVIAVFTHTLSGHAADESFTTITDADGMFRFEDLRPGDYTVSISDFDTRDYEFAATSDDVSVDLDETGTVSFTGVLLRTSGISGRVSVEGMGLDNVAVTLSGAADASTMTDAGGQYNFAGLAAGDYTVSIAVESDAYVFDETSKPRTVGDDESAIVNFDGQHARTASVSGQFFLDELNKNNMMDAGEDPLPAPGVQVVLVGPGVNQQTSSQTGPDGSFMFSGLRAGVYQLVVPIDATAAAALAANDVAYGGEGAGYPVTLGVGERKSQDIPFDITHTTVNVAVTLKGGEYRGDAIPGASVAFYSGDTMVGSGATEASEAGVFASVRVARAAVDGNTVHMMVGAEGYFVDPMAGMQAVTWDPQSFVHPAADADPPAVLNDADIVNLNVNVNVSGETVTTDYGGGDALGGWAITVTSGDEAVAGAPTMLDDDGNASFTTVVAPDALPATFAFAAADDQDDELDGGESYEASGGMYVHTGLTLAGDAVDADPIVVRYTTQTLKVFVHQEVDQAHGYTGNVGHGDTRKSGLVTLRVVRPSTGSLTRSLSGWDGEDNTSDDKKGGYTFKNLPADEDVVVLADARDGYKLLAPHRLDTYRNLDDNGVAGSAFGDHGGWGHTVMLCPLQATAPTGQNFDECGSFAVVATHDVSATVSKMTVEKSTTGFKDPSSTNEVGLTVSLSPVEGKNLAGEGESFETTKKNKGAHDFGAMAAGTYEVGLPEGWRGMSGDESAASAFSPLDGDVELTVTPTTATVYGFVRAKAPQDPTEPGLANVTVAVGDLTTQTDAAGRYIISGITAGKKVTVTAQRAGYPDAKNEFASLAANTVTQSDFDLSGSNNTVTISGRVTEQGTDNGIKGVVIKVDGSAPLNAATSGTDEGKLVTGDDGSYEAIVNATDPTTNPTVTVAPSADGWNFIPASLPVSGINGGTNVNFQGWRTTRITGMVLGVKPFSGSRSGMSDVEVTATWQGVAPGSDDYETGPDGIFFFDVPTLAGSVTITAAPIAEGDLDPYRADYAQVRDAARYVWFDPPDNRLGGSMVFIPGQRTVHFGTFEAQSVQPRITKVERVAVKDAYEGEVTASGVVPLVAARTDATGGAGTAGFALVRGEPTDTIKVTWKYETRNLYATSGLTAADNAYSADDTGVDATGAADNNNPTAVGAGVAPALGVRVGTPVWAVTAATTLVSGGTAAAGATVSHTRTTTLVIPDADDIYYDEIDLRIGNAVVDANGTPRANTVALSLVVEEASVANPVSELSARVAPPPATAQENHHLIDATWKATGSPQMEQRVALWVGGIGVDNDEEGWLIVPDAALTITRSTTFGANFARWSMDDINLSTVTIVDGDWITENLGVAALNVDRVDLLNASRLLVQTRAHDTDDWQSVAVDISGR